MSAKATPLLDVSGLTVGFPLEGHDDALAANEVAFSVRRGETLGIVGESGCGKSVTLRALLSIVPMPGRVLGGTARWKGERDLLALPPKALRQVRGKEIAMIFQDPQNSLNPVYSIGDQLTEVLRKRLGLDRRQARVRAVELLDRVGIPSPQCRLGDHPHEFSGGMRQRVMIALAIACDPLLLLADEPTTALDVTVQDQILGLLQELQRESGMALIMVSHDLGVIGQCSDRLAVMYAGRVVETGSIDEVLTAPRHPYTAALLEAVPGMPDQGARGRVQPIQGQPPAITALPAGCSFAPRCPFVRAGCERVDMALDRHGEGHGSACPFVNAASATEVAHAAT
jgi:oligopeptide/dipeptide ABC transporter ATP-binding protein